MICRHLPSSCRAARNQYLSEIARAVRAYRGQVDQGAREVAIIEALERTLGETLFPSRRKES